MAGEVELERCFKPRVLQDIMVKFCEKRELLKAVTSSVSYYSPVNILQSH